MSAEYWLKTHNKNPLSLFIAITVRHLGFYLFGNFVEKEIMKSLFEPQKIQCLEVK